MFWIIFCRGSSVALLLSFKSLRFYLLIYTVTVFLLHPTLQNRGRLSALQPVQKKKQTSGDWSSFNVTFFHFRQIQKWLLNTELTTDLFDFFKWFSFGSFKVLCKTVGVTVSVCWAMCVRVALQTKRVVDEIKNVPVRLYVSGPWVRGKARNSTYEWIRFVIWESPHQCLHFHFL